MPVNVPEILSVPLVSVRNADGAPSVVVPCTVNALVERSSTLPDDVPLLIVSVRMSVVAPVPEKELLVAPVNVIPAPAALALVLKSSVPLLVRLPERDRACVVTVPPVADWNVPPAAIVTLPPTVSVRAVAVEYWRTPETPWPTVRLRQAAAVTSIVTV